MKPLAIDLYCGLGGWTEGLLAEGYEAVGFDIERHEYGEHRYPAQLVLQDVRTLHGSQFRNATLIVASPPCQEYSYMAMPWSRAKAIAAEYREGVRDVRKLTELFDACFRIQREACEAAGRHIPMVVENVRGAIPWVGRSRWNYGSFHLWGDVPALMPMTKHVKVADLPVFSAHADPHRGRKNTGGSWFNVANNTTSGKGRNPDGRKVPGLDWNDRTRRGQAFNTTDAARLREGTKQGGDWFNASQPSISRLTGSKSPARKAASAMIAKIPLPLSRHIARVYA